MSPANTGPPHCAASPLDVCASATTACSRARASRCCIWRGCTRSIGCSRSSARTPGSTRTTPWLPATGRTSDTRASRRGVSTTTPAGRTRRPRTCCVGTTPGTSSRCWRSRPRARTTTRCAPRSTSSSRGSARCSVRSRRPGGTRTPAFSPRTANGSSRASRTTRPTARSGRRTTRRTRSWRVCSTPTSSPAASRRATSRSRWATGWPTG